MGRYLQNTRLGVPSVRVIKHTYGMQINTMDHFYQYFVPMGRVQQKFGMTHVFSSSGDEPIIKLIEALTI